MAGDAINPGAYNHKLLVQRATTSTSETGGIHYAWGTIATLFGRYTPHRYQELNLGGQTRERATATFNVRKPPTAPVYRVGDRLVDVGENNATYTILYLGNVKGADRELAISVQDVQPEQ